MSILAIAPAAVAGAVGPAADGVVRLFAAALDSGSHVPSRLESILWWLPALSFVTLAIALALEIGQALPEESRWRRLAGRSAAPVAVLVGIVILLNVLRAVDIVGVI